jgi:hypothetical protein
MSFLHIHLVRICDSGMTYPDRMNVEESHIQTRWMWWNDVSGPDVCMWRNNISGPDACGGMTYPDQMHVEE